MNERNKLAEFYDAELANATSLLFDALKEIDRLRALLQQTRNYIDKDHYGMLAEVDAALSRS